MKKIDKITNNTVWVLQNNIKAKYGIIDTGKLGNKLVCAVKILDKDRKCMFIIKLR